LFNLVSERAKACLILEHPDSGHLLQNCRMNPIALCEEVTGSVSKGITADGV